jgi:hypothetical protein
VLNGYINDSSRNAATLDRNSIKFMLIQNQKNGELLLNNLNTQLGTLTHNEGVEIHNHQILSKMIANSDNLTKVKELEKQISNDYQTFTSAKGLS